MKRQKAWALPIIVLGSIFFLMAASCYANETERYQVQDQQGIYLKNQPVRTYQYSAEREALIQLLEQRVKGNLNTWTVWVSANGTPLGMCASKGYPLPYSSELTNPTQTGGVGQMDPNGIYPSQNTEATWVLCLDDTGALHPQYIEPMVLAFTYPVEIRDGKIVQVGKASAESAITQSGGK